VDVVHKKETTSVNWWSFIEIFYKIQSDIISSSNTAGYFFLVSIIFLISKKKATNGSQIQTVSPTNLSRLLLMFGITRNLKN